MTRSEEILKGFNETHKYKYTYPNYTAKNLQEKVKIICPEHGEFIKFGYCHLRRKQGCPKCSHIGLSRYTEEEFMDSLIKTHGYPLPFEILSPYVGNKDDIMIRDKYGVCKTKPYNLTRTSYGSLRTAIDKTAYMVAKFNEKHNFKYTYDNFVYKGNRVLGTVTCPEHGDFEQLVDVHLMGCGCPKCADSNKVSGYGRNDYIRVCKEREASLYIICCYSEDEFFVKVGITSTGVNKRFRDRSAMPYEFSSLFETIGDPAEIWDLELSLKRKYKGNTYLPQVYFKGQTECFTFETAEKMIEEIKNKFVNAT